MLQRKQTLFLLISIITVFITFFFPLITFFSELEFYKVYACRIENMIPTEESIFGMFFILPLTLLLVISVVFSVVTIINFKNRLYQMKLVKVNVFVTVLINVAIFFAYPFLMERNIAADANFQTGAYFPLISLVFLVIANRFILKDEKLVKSIDRIR